MANYSIVRATLDHLDPVAPLFDSYRTFYGQPPDLAIARSFLKARLERNESVIFLALNAQGEGLGFTQLYPSFSSTSARRLWILNDLFVAETARRSGVARALMEAARRFAAADGALELELQTAVDNINAQRLYESLGYVRDTHYYTYILPLDTPA